jgi:SAM-dependent methyltransferase
MGSEFLYRLVHDDARLRRLPAEIRDALGPLDHPTWIAGVDEVLAHVRLDPRRGLVRARDRLAEIRASVPPAERVAWLLPNPYGWGLDPEEARAVADEVLAVDAAFAVGSDAEAHTIVLGRVRRDVVGLLLTLHSLDAAAVRRVYRHARRVRKSGIGCAGVLVGVAGASRQGAAHASRVAWLAARRVFPGVPIGFWVSRDANPARLSGDARWVARYGEMFEAYLDTDAEDAVRARPRSTAPVAQLTWAAVDNPTDTPGSVERPGPWLSAGAYFGLRFDSRVPARNRSTAGMLQVVRVQAGRGFLDTWARARGPRPDLAAALDYYRFESYLRRSTDVGLAQRYHEFKVYLTSQGGPHRRTTLIQIDETVSEGACALLLEEMALAAAASHGTLVIERGAAFFAAARDEAELRLASGPAVADVLGHQRSAHLYLHTIAPDEPLRADVSRLVSIMPAALGTALELGAGLGRLARELAPRSRRYVCVDLDADTVPRANARLSSIAADFQRLPFAGGTFDTVIANNVLEHAADPVGALEEIARVLAPGGRLYALVPLDALNSAYDLPAHLWKADMRGISRAVAAAGLSVVHGEPINLYALGIPACFPACYGWVCLLVAGRQER